MAVVIAQNVITSFVQGVISSNLIDLASKEVGPLLGVRGDITYIIVELEMMKAFLRSAEEKQETDFMNKNCYHWGSLRWLEADGGQLWPKMAGSNSWWLVGATEMVVCGGNGDMFPIYLEIT
ncbi:hypothetical protein IEQ34_006367 [Dendrobium chrysotoxum]|uniref:Disease resistance N-terminal domain-containing protein n=1 Tax=Dendrobium chrysotoxum TaxID=161865 RepID=A0AAV7HEQ6_DENCH|nr:hypothetical protein IEQ34_006367 [Dendrobium chrysotoxum]